MSANGKHPDFPSWRETPKPILAAIRKAQAGVADLRAIANGHGLKRNFTLDGRLVGDIGELLLCDDFAVLPRERSDGYAHDLVAQANSGRIQLQVKLRCATKGGRIEFKYQPECLVVIECKHDWSLWRILYNGPGEIVTDDGVEVRPADRRILRKGMPGLVFLSRNRLAEADTNLPRGARRLGPKTSKRA